MSEVCKKILMLLKDNKIVEAETNLDDFVNLIYKPGEQRLEILLWMISKLCDSCGNHLEKTENPDLDVAFKLSNLHFVKSTDKMNFVKGNLPVKQQEVVFNKIFKSLYSICFLQCNSKPGHNFKDNFKTQPRLSQFKYVKGIKQKKSFHFNEARHNIKNSKNLVQSLESLQKEMLLKKELEPETDYSITNLAVPEVDNLKTDFFTSASNLQFLTSYSCGVNEQVQAELDKAVQQLYCVSHAFNKIPEIFPHEFHLRITQKHDLRRPVDDLNDLGKSSLIIQLNKLNSSTVK